MDSKQFQEVAAGLEEYLAKLFNSIDHEYFEAITGDVFDGCEVCQLRETIAYLKQHYHIKEKGNNNE